MAQKALDNEVVRRGYARAMTDIERFNAHPWYAIQKGWVVTQDEHPMPGEEAVRTLPTREYLEAIVDEWFHHRKGMIFKARQMMLSWVFSYLMLWDAISLPARHNIIQGKREDDVKAKGDKGIMGRLRFIRNHFPPIIRPQVGGEATTYETYANGSTVEAIPEGEHVIRSKVPSNLFMDELAFHSTGEDNWNAAVPAVRGAGRIWGVSTPNGHEFMYKQHDVDKQWDQLTGGGIKGCSWPEKIPGMWSYTNQVGIRLVGLHYTSHAPFRTPEWQKMNREGYTEARKYKRENELDFTLADGAGVYANEFSRALHIMDTKYVVEPTVPIHRGWDFGFNGQACAFFQENHLGQIVNFDMVFHKRVALERVVHDVKSRTTNHYANANSQLGTVLNMDGSTTRTAPRIHDYGDPSAKANNTDGRTDMMTLKKFGINLVTVKTIGRKQDLVDQVRTLLLPRGDGRPALVFARNSPEMDYVIAAMAGGYHYAEPKGGKAEKETPHKDGFYDHMMDAIQYAIDRIRPTRGAVLAPDEMINGKAWWDTTEPGIGTPGY